MEKRIITKLLLLINFVSLFIYPVTETLDVNTFRLLSFSLINSFSLLYILISGELTSILFKVLKSKISIAIVLFIIWGALSVAYAGNITQVFLRVLFFINFYFTFLTLYVFISYNKIRAIHIAAFISILVLAQLYYSYNALWAISRVTTYDFSFNELLKGRFPNRNITAAIYLYQLPFIIYIFQKSKSKIIKIISAISILSLLHMIFLMSARTSYIVIFVLGLVYVLLYIIKREKEIFQFGLIFILSVLTSYLTSTYSLGTNNSAYVFNRMNTINFQEESTNTRLRYYEYGFQQFIKNPLIGVGLGNWKIESIEKDKENIISYVIPYTMHNDFLEVAAELGIIGLSFYILIFLFALIYLYKHFIRNKFDPYLLALTSFIVVYLVDANLNFPFIRASQQLYLALFLSLALYSKNYNTE